MRIGETQGLVHSLSRSVGNVQKSAERLSTGLRINHAADDASGLAVRELMRADIAATRQGIRNAMDAISMIQTIDGALAIIDEKLIRMRELAEQAATGTYNDVQREMINNEYMMMGSEIERIANASEWNGQKLIKDYSKNNKINADEFSIASQFEDTEYQIPITEKQYIIDNSGNIYSIKSDNKRLFNMQFSNSQSAALDLISTELISPDGNIEQFCDDIKISLLNVDSNFIGDTNLVLSYYSVAYKDYTHNEGYHISANPPIDFPEELTLTFKKNDPRVNNRFYVDDDTYTFVSARYPYTSAQENKYFFQVINDRNCTGPYALYFYWQNSSRTRLQEVAFHPRVYDIEQDVVFNYNDTANDPYNIDGIATTVKIPQYLPADPMYRYSITGAINQFGLTSGTYNATDNTFTVSFDLEDGSTLKQVFYANMKPDAHSISYFSNDIIVDKVMYNNGLNVSQEGDQVNFVWNDLELGSDANNTKMNISVLDDKGNVVKEYTAVFKDGRWETEDDFTIHDNGDFSLKGFSEGDYKFKIILTNNGILENKNDLLSFYSPSFHYIDYGDNNIKIHFGEKNTEADSYAIDKKAVSLKSLNLDLNSLKTQIEAQNSLLTLREAITKKDQVRAYFGIMQNRLENTIANLQIKSDAMKTAESRISNADIAYEMTNFIRQQILTESGMAMLAQADLARQYILEIIK